jgi:hypothetical protein
MNKYLKLFKKSVMIVLKNNYGEKRAVDIWNQTEKIYDKFLNETPSIGGRENLMSHNLYGALLVFAVYEAIGEDLTGEEIQEYIDVLFTNKFKRIGKIIHIGFLTHNPVKKLVYAYFGSYKKKADKYKGGKWNNTWGIELNPEGHKKGVAITLVGCPIADFAKKHGYLHLMPYMCKSDYIVAKSLHGKLIRNHTVAEGHTTCDYWYLGNNEAAEDDTI